MKKRILSMILMLMLIIAIVGCGVGEEEKSASKEAESNETQETETTDVAETEEVIPQDKTDTEVTVEAEEYEEQEDVFVYKNIDIGDGTQIDLTNREIIYGPFILPESIDVYSNYLTYAGYTKPDIEIFAVGKVNDDWLTVAFAQSGFLVKAEDFDRVAVLVEQEEDDSTEESYAESVIKSMQQSGSTQSQTQNEGNSGVSNETPTTTESATQTEASDTQVQAPAPVETTTTYSEADVINIVETALRDAGFRKPEEIFSAEDIAEFGPTAGMGWGIDNIPMNDPYTEASKIVEGFQFSHYNVYYIENLGSSDGYVSIKMYRGTHK